MGRGALVMRMFAALVLGLWLAGAGALSALAQDDTGDGTPPPTEEPSADEAAQGTLVFAVYTCTAGPEGVAGTIALPGEFTPDASCSEGGTADVAIDGNPAEAVEDGGSVTLAAGEHTIDEATIGAPVTITVTADEPVTVSIVFYAAAAAAEVPTGTLSIVTHVCPETVADAGSFDAVGDFYAKVLKCPTITLPGNAAEVVGENANDQVDPPGFDYTVGYDEGGTPASKTLADANFAAAALCESDVAGADWDAGAPADRCLDESAYAFAAVPLGSVTVTLTQPPDGYAYGASAFRPDSGEDAPVLSEDVAAGAVTLDTTGNDAVTLHVFAFLVPATNRITIVKHRCGDAVTADDFAALPDFYAKAEACPTVRRYSGDAPSPGTVAGGVNSFDFTVQGNDGTVQTLTTDGTFVNGQLCEDDFSPPQDFDNGDAGTNTCLDESGYRFDEVLQGSVVVTETKFSKSTMLGGAAVDPEADPEVTIQVSGNEIQLDTTSDGDVTLHVFNLVKPATPTPTPTKTRTPSPTPTATNTPEPGPATGTLQIIKLYCIGDTEETVMTPLLPGEEATADDLGDDTCLAGGADFTITAFGTDDLGTYTVGDDGRLAVTDLPVTSDGSGPHVLTETYSGATADFDIEEGAVTNVVVLNYEPDEILDETGEGETLDDEGAVGDAVDSSDEEDIASGEDLAETGIGPMGGPVDGGAVLLLGAAGLVLLAGAGVLRRRAG